MSGNSARTHQIDIVYPPGMLDPLDSSALPICVIVSSPNEPGVTSPNGLGATSPIELGITSPIELGVSSPNKLSDTSRPLFSLYSKMAGEDDSINGERHQKDAEGIILFVSLHSLSHS